MPIVFSLIRLLIILENKFYAFTQSLTDYTNRRKVSVIPIPPCFPAMICEASEMVMCHMINLILFNDFY
jgi:hypothetical protein